MLSLASSSTSLKPSKISTISCCHQIPKPVFSARLKTNKRIPTLLLNAGVVGLALLGGGVGPAIAGQSPFMLELTEPSNALSLPTWAVHVSSVAEWIIAMALVWQYGQKPGNESWKGLTWGMVPLLGGAMCACTWHFFYNAETLEVLVALQAALTFFGNVTLCIAAFRIYQSQNQSEKI
ncbi:hypothetical protein KSS87_008540 [Heliosperma pusillum]|nr:hypothetical protein KSS87_008540 [Heliosperma pusillum]